MCALLSRVKWAVAGSIGVLLLALAARGASQDAAREGADPAPTFEDIERRIVELAATADANEHAGDVVEQARLALDRARTLSQQHKAADSERAKQIAWAAVALASRRVALGRERAALRAAERRAAELEREAVNLRQRLEQAMAERAAAERDPVVAGTPAVPPVVPGQTPEGEAAETEATEGTEP